MNPFTMRQAGRKPMRQLGRFRPSPMMKRTVAEQFDPEDQVDVMGFFNFKKLFKGIGKGLASVAKIVGPAIATVVPGSGPIVAAGLKVLKSAQRGDRKSKLKIAKIKLAAAQGNPRALKSMDALLAAREVQKNVKAEGPPAACPVCKR